MRDSNEHVMYLLNSVVGFHPAERILTSCMNGCVVTLHAPSSLCLAKLIVERSNIVSQEELILVGWPETSDKVSPNTFYQMVFNLRQGLEKVGGQGIIVTVPRRGLKINPETTVETIDNQREKFPEENKSTERDISSFTRSAPLKNGCKFLLIVLTVFLLSISSILYTLIPDSNFSDDYNVTQYKQCTIKFNSTIDKAIVRKLLSKSSIDCSLQKRIILTQSKNHSRLSVISCPAGTVNTKGCSLSLYVQRVSHE
ncbi:winged helix-turn-helix domain-containing protein [Enterobacter hormaechei]|uniref:winged helix-turn-helix domain-containing protein n=1 Tax=Enterobacter hormaechei TaxID=158836 RepID=UPI0013D6D365|nr:winged helix-turn-helix domain-containing protein [Enterobacter hormaechei]ELV3390473.1 winged helix-turn-helix domain-containing protein [Enterobacter hormaechei]